MFRKLKKMYYNYMIKQLNGQLVNVTESRDNVLSAETQGQYGESIARLDLLIRCTKNQINYYQDKIER